MPIPPRRVDRLFGSKTSRTIPFALHWKKRPLAPQVTIPQASWPLCCSKLSPSQISGAASASELCKRSPRIPHTTIDPISSDFCATHLQQRAHSCFGRSGKGLQKIHSMKTRRAGEDRCPGVHCHFFNLPRSSCYDSSCAACSGIEHSRYSWAGILDLI